MIEHDGPAQDVPEDAVRAQPPPHAWLTVGLGMGAALVGAGVCALLLIVYLGSRPLNLNQYTASHTNLIEDLLAANNVPRHAIGTLRQEQRADDRARWQYIEMAVELPETVSVDGVVKLIRKEMALRNINVTEARSGPGRAELHLAAAGRKLVRINLRPKGIVPLPDAEAPSPQCEKLAHEVMALLQDNALAQARQTFPVRDYDASSDPAPYRIEIEPSSILSLEQLKDFLLHAVTDRHISVSSDQGKSARAMLTLHTDGGACVELVEAPSRPRATPAQTNLAERTPTVAANRQPGRAYSPAHGLPGQADAASRARTRGTVRPAGEGGPPKVAIIVDDGGELGDVTDSILASDRNVTLSILPKACAAAVVAERALENGFEIMLHMPMEAHTPDLNAPGTIRTAMDADEIRRLTEEALADVPGATGANNHTGSAFTTDEAAMAPFLTVLKNHGLYFVDSRTDDRTVAYALAKRMGVPTVERDVFLDNDADPDSIRRQTQELIATAQTNGFGVAICHFRPTTADMLDEIVATIEAAGIELVRVSELVR